MRKLNKFIFLLISLFMIGCSKVGESGFKIPEDTKYIFSYRNESSELAFFDDFSKEIDIMTFDKNYYKIGRDNDNLYLIDLKAKINYKYNLDDREMGQFNDLNDIEYSNNFNLINNYDQNVFFVCDSGIFDEETKNYLEMKTEGIQDVKKIQDTYYVLNCLDGDKDNCSTNETEIIVYNIEGEEIGRVLLSEYEAFKNIQNFALDLNVVNDKVIIIGSNGEIFELDELELNNTGKIEGFQNNINTRIESNGDKVVISSNKYNENGIEVQNIVLDKNYRVTELENENLKNCEIQSVTIINNIAIVLASKSNDDGNNIPLVLEINLDNNSVESISEFDIENISTISNLTVIQE